MLANEIAALFPKAWELARQKYARDLVDLTRLFIRKSATAEKKSVFRAAPLKTLGETQKIFSETGPFHSCFRPFHSVGKVEGGDIREVRMRQSPPRTTKQGNEP